MTSEMIYGDPDRSLEMRVDDGYSPDFLDLLHRTVWGTEGLLYLTRALDGDLTRIPRFRAIELRIDSKLVGAYGLGYKTAHAGECSVEAIHRMFLAVDREYLGKGLGKLLVEQTKRHFLDSAQQPVMLYGYIEEQNSRSLEISKKMGYEPIGAFRSLLFSRFRPRACDAIEQPADASEIAELLQQQYAEFSLVDLHQSLLPDEYYLLRRDGVVVAGIQAHMKRWSIVELEGWHGRMLLKMLPRTPGLRRLLPQGEYRFLSVSNLYCAAGHEEDLFALLEGLLVQHGLYIAMAFLDVNCPLLQRLLKSGKFGMLSKLGLDSEAVVMAGFNGVDEATVAEFRKRPLLISPLDPT